MTESILFIEDNDESMGVMFASKDVVNIDWSNERDERWNDL